MKDTASSVVKADEDMHIFLFICPVTITLSQKDIKPEFFAYYSFFYIHMIGRDLVFYVPTKKNSSQKS